MQNRGFQAKMSRMSDCSCTARCPRSKLEWLQQFFRLLFDSQLMQSTSPISQF